jgi:hypothetical protein
MRIRRSVENISDTHTDRLLYVRHKNWLGTPHVPALIIKGFPRQTRLRYVSSYCSTFGHMNGGSLCISCNGIRLCSHKVIACCGKSLGLCSQLTLSESHPDSLVPLLAVVGSTVQHKALLSLKSWPPLSTSLRTATHTLLWSYATLSNFSSCEQKSDISFSYQYQFS